VVSLLGMVAVEHADIMYDVNMAKAPLLDVLRSYRDFESTDPKDKVYGLMNLVAPKCEAEALKIDYDKSFGEVYADTVLSVIRLHSRLTTLAYVTHPEEYCGNDEIRSWALRWDDLWVAMSIGIPERSCPWSACDGYPVKIVDTHHIEPEQLRLVGIFYDTVTTVQVVMDHENLLDPEELDEIHPFLGVHSDIIPGSVLTSYDDFKEQWCTLARTLAAGSSGDSTYVQELSEEAQDAYYEAFVRSMKRLFTLSSPDTETPIIHDPASLIFQANAYHYCKQRRVFWTQNRSYGLSPECMRTGMVNICSWGKPTLMESCKDNLCMECRRGNYKNRSSALYKPIRISGYG
jgi:hypothetical protein